MQAARPSGGPSGIGCSTKNNQRLSVAYRARPWDEPRLQDMGGGGVGAGVDHLLEDACPQDPDLLEGLFKG